jgi:hypothetical protein
MDPYAARRGLRERETDMDMTKYWTPDGSKCELCGKEFENKIPEADMFDPNKDDQSYIVHLKCGARRGWEVA